MARDTKGKAAFPEGRHGGAFACVEYWADRAAARTEAALRGRPARPLDEMEELRASVGRYQGLVASLHDRVAAFELEVEDLKDQAAEQGGEVGRLRDQLTHREEEARRDCANRAATEASAQNYEKTGAGIAAGLLGLIFAAFVSAATRGGGMTLGQLSLCIGCTALAYGLVRSSHVAR